MRRIFSAIAIFAASVLASAATAQQAPAPSASDWTGFYMGASSGNLTSTGIPCAEGAVGYDCNPVPTLPNLPQFTPEGRFQGATVGYDWQRGNLVFGVAGDVMNGSAFDTEFTSGGFGCSTRCEMEVTRTVMLRGRIGFAPIDSLMAYATAGVAYTTATADVIGLAPPPGEGTFTNNIIGFGGEYRLNDHLSLGMEYLRLLETDDKISFQDSLVPAYRVTNFSGDMVRATIGIRF